MKINWPIGLTIFFILFVATLIFILYQSRQVEDSLVMQDYYEEDIKYQAQYDKKQNTADLDVKVRVAYKSQEKVIMLIFPMDSTSQISGQILLYNPVSDKSDVKMDFNLGSKSTYLIPTDKLSSGRWKVKIDWKNGDKPFYQEEEIFI
ncbi:MAG: FixH family protein [Saprospiraceae bacterium]